MLTRFTGFARAGTPGAGKASQQQKSLSVVDLHDVILFYRDASIFVLALS
jgi:hypothetical protein